MDATGDADEADAGWHDELRSLTGATVWTPEAQAFTAAGLVLASFFGQGLFQLLAYLVDKGDLSQHWRALLYAGPGTVLALDGATVGWRARRLPSTPAVRGLAVSAAIVGGHIALTAGASIVVALTSDDATTAF
jgi:hypothetical protein